jgi:hypothetical protein
MRWTQKLAVLLRSRRGLTARFCRDLGYPVSTVNKWIGKEGAWRSPRDAATIVPRVAEFLDVDLGWLLDESRGMPPVPRNRAADVYADLAKTAGALELRVIFEALSRPETSRMLCEYAAMLLRTVAPLRPAAQVPEPTARTGTSLEAPARSRKPRRHP